MRKKPRDKSTRQQLRTALRSADKLAELREKLAALQPGATPERPIEVSSAAVVELRAETFACLRCEGRTRAEDHAAISDASGETRRRVGLRCVRCGALRTLYFCIAKPLH